MADEKPEDAAMFKIAAAAAVLVAPLACVAGASLWIYLTHWQVYPHLEVDHSFWATAASLVGGVLAWRAWRLLEARVSRLRTRTAT